MNRGRAARQSDVGRGGFDQATVAARELGPALCGVGIEDGTQFGQALAEGFRWVWFRFAHGFQ